MTETRPVYKVEDKVRLTLTKEEFFLVRSLIKDKTLQLQAEVINKGEDPRWAVTSYNLLTKLEKKNA